MPVGFWEAVIEVLPAIAKEVAQSKTPEEKLEIANKDIHPIMQAWSYTPVGLINESLMEESAKNTPTNQRAPWSSTNSGLARLWDGPSTQCSRYSR